MSSKPKFLALEPGEVFSHVSNHHLTEMQNDGTCDTCQKPLPKDTQVLGKIVTVTKGPLVGAKFSPTCLRCMDYN